MSEVDRPCLVLIFQRSHQVAIEILERFHSKALGMIVDAPWYVPNTVIRRDLQILIVKEEIRLYSLNMVPASVHIQMT
jgi:hypothetical protein